MSRQLGDDRSEMKAPPVATATHSEAEAVLTAGAVYRGTVMSRQEDGTYTVKLDTPGHIVNGVLLASTVLGGLMGFNIRTILSKDTLVELAWGKPPFIHSVLPHNNKDWLNGKSRTMLWAADPTEGSGDNFSEVPADMFEGEFEISNLFGVAMEFLTTLVRMGAGARAQVECHLINDMVRIISSQYRHFSGIGEELIFDHGRPTMERSWSSYRHELMNQLKIGAGGDLAKLNGDALDKEVVDAQRLTAIGRYRLLEFIGFAGDFIHSFVADPPETLASMAAELNDSKSSVGAGAGKSWIHRNSDGSVLVQSVADIVLERVVRIPVPFRTVNHEAPDLVTSRDYAKLDDDYLKMMDIGSREKRTAYRAAYQLRTYSRWLSRVHAVVRMLQLESEYSVPTEAEAPEPSWTNAEVDKERANADVRYYDAYACIAIRRDGSIVLHDGYGSSIVMSNGNLQVSASRHLDLEAAGDIRMVAGGSLFVKARRNIEMTAEKGGILFFCRAYFKALCERGSLWLRSSADISQAPSADDDDPMPEVAGYNGEDEAQNKPTAVMIEAPRGNVVVRSDRGVGIHIEGVPDENDYEPGTHDFSVSTGGSCRLRASNHVMLACRRDLLLTASRAISTVAPRLYGRLGEIDLEGGLNYAHGKLSVTETVTQSLSANTVKARSNGGHSTGGDPVGPHLNHIDILHDPVGRVPEGQDKTAIAARDFAKSNEIHDSTCPWKTSQEGPAWGFSMDGEYIWDTREEDAGSLIETLTQQFLKSSDVAGGSDMWQGAGYDTWSWALPALVAPRAGNPGGFGVGRSYFSTAGESLRKPSATSHDELLAVEPDWESTDTITFKYLKR